MADWPAPAHGYDPRVDGADCASCPIGPNGFLFTPKWGWAPIPAEHRDVDTIAIAENPSDKEREKGYPFAGPSGDWWGRGLQAVGKKRTDVAISNVIACQCPDQPTGAYERMTYKVSATNKRLVEAGVARGEDPATIAQWKHPAECCRPRLMKDIAPYRNVITLGGTSAKEILHVAQGIMAIHGSPSTMPSSSGEVRKVLPTFHPSFVARSPQWFRDWAGDLARSDRYFHDALTWRDPAILWQPTVDQLRAWLAEPTPTGRTVSDVETDGTEPLRCGLNCIGMAKRAPAPICASCFYCGGSGRDPSGAPGVKGDYACVVCLGAGTWWTRTRAVLIPWNSREDGTNPYSASEQVAIFELLAKHWEDHSQWKMGHNFVVFDQGVLTSWAYRVLKRHVRIWPIYDTLVPAKIATPDLPKGLGAMGQRYSDVFAWKSDHSGKKIAWHAQNALTLGVYCSRDTAVNDEVSDPLIEDAIKKGLRDPLRPDIKPATWPAHVPWTLEGADRNVLDMCAGLHATGMYVLHDTAAAHARTLIDVKEKFRAICVAKGVAAGLPENWNPGSTEQLIELIHGRWNWPIRARSKQTDQPSTADAVLREHIVDKSLPEDQRDFIDAVRRFRRAGKAKSTFVDAVSWEDVQISDSRYGICWRQDGRVHSKWNQLTGVGRLNTSDMNVQNIPVRYRDMFGPAPGHVLVSADMDQLHLRIIANRWRIKALLEGFIEGIDPHCSLAFKFFPKEFPILDGWGEKGFSLKRKPKKDSDADKIRSQAKVIRYQGAYADIPLGIHRSVTKVENKKGELIYRNVTPSQVQAWYDIWMEAEPDWETSWAREEDLFRRNGGWIGDALFNRHSGALEGGKKQAVVNWPILATEPCIMRIAESNVLAAFPFGFAGPGTGMINQCHDSITIEVPGACWEEAPGRVDQGPAVFWKKKGDRLLCWDKRAEDARRTLEECMTVRIPGWEIPFTCEGGVGRTWAEA